MQDYYHGYSAPFHIKFIYKGFILTVVINYCSWYKPFKLAVLELYDIDPKGYIYLSNTSQGV